MNTDEVILGVDTHLKMHVGVLISNTGKCLGALSVTTDAAGYLSPAEADYLSRTTFKNTSKPESQ